jgi:ubiquinone/menaquinone biosynthesis C-methylase UbiE
MGGNIFKTQRGSDILDRARDPKNQTPEFRRFLLEEKRYILGRVEGGCVLDIGCGAGDHLKALSGRCEMAAGIDNSLLEIKKARIAVRGISNAGVMLADAEELPFKAGSFDYAICTMSTIGNMNDEVKVLAEVARVLKDGGKLEFSFYKKSSESARKRFYDDLGWDETWIGEGTVFLRLSTGIAQSRSYSEKRIREIGANAGFRIKVYDLCDIACMCEASKNS